MCNATFSYTWQGSNICVRRLVHMRDMNQSYIWHMCEMTDSHAWHDPHIYMRHGTYLRASHDVFICLRPLFHVCAMFPMTRLHVTKRIHVCSMTRSHVIRRIHTCGKPNACVTWLVAHDMKHPYAFMCDVWLIQAWPYSSICVAYLVNGLIHMSHVLFMDWFICVMTHACLMNPLCIFWCTNPVWVDCLIRDITHAYGRHDTCIRATKHSYK